MNFLITGATGFIGTRLVNSLLFQGHMVDYIGARRSAALDTRAAFHPWNREQEPRLDAIPQPDAVIHLAGEPVAQRWTDEVKEKIRDSRVLGTRRLVAALGKLKNKPKVLVSGSAIGYYGNRGDEILTERSQPGQGFLAEVCVAWEREAEAAREFGARVVEIRTGIVLGKEGGALKQMLPPFQMGLGGPFGDGRQWVPWIHVDDLVGLFQFASKTETMTGPANGSAPNLVNNKDFSHALAGALHRPALLAVPKFALKMMLGEMAESIFDSVRAIPEVALHSGFVYKYPEIGPALQALLA